MTGVRPLAGVRVVESSLLGPAEIGGLLADLGADVIKVEPPGGDYGRRMTWPIVRSQDGKSEASLLSLHVNRGKRSVVLDLRRPEAVQAYLDLVKGSDVVIEAMRPGALARRGLGYEQLRAANPKIVFCTISGYGATGPYRDLPSHGIAYDSWAGQMPIGRDEKGRPYIEEHPSIGIHAGPAYGALAILAGVLQARAGGEGQAIEIAQSDAAAFFDWYRIETWRSYERPEDEVYGNATDGGQRRPPGTGGMREGVRYQVYESNDGMVIFMASEQEFWKNFCTGIGREELFERWPGEKYADHAAGNEELHEQLTRIFASRSTADWVRFGQEHNTAIAPVNTPRTVIEDPQFLDRLPWVSASRVETDMLPFPAHFGSGGDGGGPGLEPPTRAPVVGQHTTDVLAEVAGYDEGRIRALREAGAAQQAEP